MTIYNDRPERGAAEAYDVPITKQLTGALRQFRARATATDENLVVWSDALCINQLDPGERPQQVLIMRKLYAAARSVWAWLGDSDPDAQNGLINFFALAACDEASATNSDDTLDMLKCTDDDLDLEDLRQLWLAIKESNWDNEDYQALENDLIAHDPLETAYGRNEVRTVAALVCLPYWYRGWVIQEARANSLVVLHYARVRCTVNDWSAFTQALKRKQAALVLLFGMRDIEEFGYFLAFLDFERNSWYTPELDMVFKSKLALTRIKRSTQK